MEKKRLGDICEIVTGATPKTNIKEFWDGDINWITPAELTEDTYIINESLRKITTEGVEKTGLKSFPKGTVILSSRAPIGKVAIAGCEMYCNQGFKNLVCSKQINNRFLYWYLKGHKEYLNSLGRGATFKEISKAIVENIEICLPTLEKQEKYADILEQCNGIIQIKKGQLRKLDTLVKSRFVELFGNVFLNTMKWEEHSLELIADIVSGITKGRKMKQQTLMEVPYMAVSNVKDGYIDWTTIKTIKATEQEINQYRLLPNDVLMTEGGDPDKVGRGAIIRKPLENCIHQNHIFRVRLNTTYILPEFFAEYLQHQRAKRYFLRCAKQTTGIASINMKQLRALPVLIPPIELQNQFADFVASIDKSKSKIQKSLEETQLLFDSLMQKYFG